MYSGRPWEKFYHQECKDFDADNLAFTDLVHLERHAFENHADEPAFTTVLPNGAKATITYEELHNYSNDFAAYLREIVGLSAGDTVALMTPNCIDFPIAAFGAIKAGCRITNVNPLYTAEEMEHQLKDSNARLLVIIDMFGDKVDAVIKNTNVETVVTLSLLDFFSSMKKMIIGFVLKRVKKVIPEMTSPRTKISAALVQGNKIRISKNIDVAGYTTGINRDDVIVYQYTGGTTGRSKGAELTHRSILANALQAEAIVVSLKNEDLNKKDTVLVALPLYHITAFSLILMPALINGQHALMIPSPRPPSNLQTAFENFEVNYFTGINTLYAALLEEPWFGAEVVKHLKFCGSGGAAQHVAVAERWQKVTGKPIIEGYGMTECSGVMTLNFLDSYRLGTVGIPVPGVDIRIVGEDGTDQPLNTPGELWCKAPTVMKGYLDRPDATAEAITDGWLHTGDIAQMDEDGFIKIVDRLKDMILVSGFNVFPNDVEDIIAKIDGVVEVGVVGIADEKTAEAVKAFIVVNDASITADIVIAHCREHLTNYKIPKQIAFIDELPKSPVGKILRRSLRDL
jgi:long-chain acyl-CoA synthetase